MNTHISWRRWNGDRAERPVGVEPWEWVSLGLAPRPLGTVRVFLYHVGHGLIMGFPLLDILAFAWRNRDGFGTDWAERRKAEYLEDGFLDS